jgi:hypothetical protein
VFYLSLHAAKAHNLTPSLTAHQFQLTQKGQQPSPKSLTHTSSKTKGITMENQEQPKAWNEYKQSYGTTKPRLSDNSMAMGGIVLAVIVTFLTILALVVSL